MTPRATLTDAASHDLIEIWLYVGERNPKAADRLLDEINATMRRLAELPRLGRTVTGTVPGIRRMPRGSYVLFYRPTDDGIEVVRVLHGRRDLKPFTA